MKILFQGDSVTDAGRSRSDDRDLGEGYPKYTAELLRTEFPDKELEFINRGVSGDRSKNLVERLEEDFIDIDPDIVTILIGVNDTWRRFDMNDPTTASQFRDNYETVLRALRERTHAKIIMLECFLIYNKGHESYREDLNAKLDETRLLAMKYADELIPLDGLLASACVGSDPSAFSADGFHPAEEGKRFIAAQLASALRKYIK